MTNEAKMKSKFRTTSKWKNWRKYIAKLQNNKDYITGRPLTKGYQCHHLDESAENYKKLDAKNFICVNRTTHKMIHWAERYDYNLIVTNLLEVLQRMEVLK